MAEAAPAPEGDSGQDPQGGEEDLSGELGGPEDTGAIPGEIDKPVFPEELELAKLAVRALYFNIDSKDVHNMKLKIGKQVIPFEKLSDYFEKTKNLVPVLGFVEWVMDKYEGMLSKWTENPEIKGKGIVDKIKFYQSQPEEERLDNGKRVYWVRIIINCLLNGNPSMNINIADVNEDNIVEVFRLLKQHFGHDTRGLRPDMDNMEGPGVF